MASSIDAMAKVSSPFENSQRHSNGIVCIGLPERVGHLSRASFTKGVKRFDYLSLSSAEVVSRDHPEIAIFDGLMY